MTEQKEALKPCPFCGATQGNKTGGPKLMISDSGHGFTVRCTGCLACGSNSFVDERAITAWNTRSQPPVAVPGELVALRKQATPGPCRAHDHHGMARVGGDPEEWVGYAWVGRVTRESGPNGEFDAGWFTTDRRKDGCTDYRERASADAHFLAALVNWFDTLTSTPVDETKL